VRLHRSQPQLERWRPLPAGEVAVLYGLDRREHRALERGDVPLEGVPHNPPVAAVDDEIQLADRGS
jgi:hypothetical protein